MVGCFNPFLAEVASWENKGLSVLPANQITTQEGTVTYEIHIQGTTDPIEGEYVKLSATATRPSITCTIAPNNQAAPFTSTMTVHVSTSTPPETYSITVVAISSWEQAGFQETVLLTVMSLITATTINPAQTTTSPPVSTTTVTTPPVITETIKPTYTRTEMPDLPDFNFLLQIIPSTIEVSRGGAAHYQILIEYNTPEYDATPIDIKVANLIPGMFWIYNSSGLYIFTQPDSPCGTHNFQVFGSAQGITRGADGWIAVTEGFPHEEEQRLMEKERQLREEEQRRQEQEERSRAEEEERHRIEEETLITDIGETQHPLGGITNDMNALFMKLIISLEAGDPKVYAGLATAAASVLALALSKELKKIEEMKEEREKANECQDASKTLRIIVTIVLVTVILWLIWLLLTS
jgi:hypothetical protein